MTDKQVTQDQLLKVLALLDTLDMQYWIDGGWGVDILLGKQHRPHRDVDLDFDAAKTEPLLELLSQTGYEIVTDWRPCRIELFHPELGYLDIHPLELAADGSARQADLEGGWWTFRPEWFTSAFFADHRIPCISAEAQRLFHTGYELREKDRIDMENLAGMQQLR